MSKATCAFMLAGCCASLLAGAAPLRAQTSAGKPPLHLRLIYLGKDYREPTPLSFLDQVVGDKGIAGARVATADNNITGKFINEETDLAEDILPEQADIIPEPRKFWTPATGLSSPILNRRISSPSPTFPKQKTRLFSTSAPPTTRCAKNNAAAISSILRQAMRCALMPWGNFSSTRNGLAGFSFMASGRPTRLCRGSPARRIALRRADRCRTQLHLRRPHQRYRYRPSAD